MIDDDDFNGKYLAYLTQPIHLIHMMNMLFVRYSPKPLLRIQIYYCLRSCYKVSSYSLIEYKENRGSGMVNAIFRFQSVTRRRWWRNTNDLSTYNILCLMCDQVMQLWTSSHVTTTTTTKNDRVLLLIAFHVYFVL